MGCATSSKRPVFEPMPMRPTPHYAAGPGYAPRPHAYHPGPPAYGMQPHPGYAAAPPMYQAPPPCFHQPCYGPPPAYGAYGPPQYHHGAGGGNGMGMAGAGLAGFAGGMLMGEVMDEIF